MSLAKYRMLKKYLQALLLINFFLLFTGIVAAFYFFKTGMVQPEAMMFIGLGVLIFGIGLPLFFIKRMENSVRDLQTKTQQTVSRWVALWIESQKIDGKDENTISDPTFWVNLVLMGVETMEFEFKNPIFQYIADMAPMIRQALKEHKRSGKKKTRIV